MLLHYPLAVYRISYSGDIGHPWIAPSSFGNTFLGYYLSETIDIWYEASVGGPILWDTFSGLLDIYFLFSLFFQHIGKWHNFGNTFLKYYLSETFHIWSEALVGGSI